MSTIINETTDFLHEVIYSINNINKDIYFPISKVTAFLEAEGYIHKPYESYNSVSIMRHSDTNNKVVVTKSSISFEKIETECKEKYKQTFYKYLISRAKVYYQSAIQNNKAAKINLLQYQRRTCISNMYYSIHNGFAAMIEFYKLETLEDRDILNLFSDDEEAKLEHFTPNALEKLVENIDSILVNDKEEYLKNDSMNAGRVKSVENPFTWLYPLFKDEMNNDNFKSLVNKMYEYLKMVELSNIGIDSNSRRFRFETQLRESLNQIFELIDDENVLAEKKSILIVAGFISYAYMLRQLADYDSLFEVKASFTEIINWTVVTTDILEFIGDYIKEDVNENNNYIQKLEAESSMDILKNPEIDYSNVFMTITGIIVAKDFNLIELIQGLYSSKGYKMLNHNGEYTELNERSNEVIISRILFSTRLECFITISNQGLFRIDVQPSESIINTSFIRNVNLFYLEKLIVSQIIEKDIISKIDSSANIVIGIPTSSLSSELSYFELVTGVNDVIYRMIDRHIIKYLDEISKEFSNTNEFIYPRIYLLKNHNSMALRGRLRRIFADAASYERRSAYKELIDNETLKELHIIVFHNIDIDDETKNELQQNLKEEYANIKLILDFIMLTENEVKEIIEGNNELLRAKVIACRIKTNDVEDIQDSEDFNLTTNNDIDLEIEDDED